MKYTIKQRLLILLVTLVSGIGIALLTYDSAATAPAQPPRPSARAPKPAPDAPQQPAEPAPAATAPITEPAPQSQPTPRPAPAAKPQAPAPVVPSYSAPAMPNTYPSKWADAPVDTILDSWGMNNRECVSYTAWKVQEYTGRMPNWGSAIAPNANRWPALAQAAGIATGSEPRAHSVGIIYGATVGHAFWVEQVNPDGTLYISQYNLNRDTVYSTMHVQSPGATYIYF